MCASGTVLVQIRTVQLKQVSQSSLLRKLFHISCTAAVDELDSLQVKTHWTFPSLPVNGHLDLRSSPPQDVLCEHRALSSVRLNRPAAACWQTRKWLHFQSDARPSFGFCRCHFFSVFNSVGLDAHCFSYTCIFVVTVKVIQMNASLKLLQVKQHSW